MSAKQTPVGQDLRLSAAVWFERGWERAIDARVRDWESISQAERRKITNRWSLASAREIVARGDYDSFYTRHVVNKENE